jgi:hypothetical protein
VTLSFTQVRKFQAGDEQARSTGVEFQFQRVVSIGYVCASAVSAVISDVDNEFTFPTSHTVQMDHSVSRNTPNRRFSFEYEMYPAILCG